MNEVLVLNAVPKIDKLYTIMGSRNHSASDEVLDTGVPGLSMAQELCHELKGQYGDDYDVWIVPES